MALDPALFQPSPAPFVPDPEQLKRDAVAAAMAKEANLNADKDKKGQLSHEDSRRRTNRQDLRNALKEILDNRQNIEVLNKIDITLFVAAWENNMWDLTGGIRNAYEDKAKDALCDCDDWLIHWEAGDALFGSGVTGHDMFEAFLEKFPQSFDKDEEDVQDDDDVDAEGETDDEDYYETEGSDDEEGQTLPSVGADPLSHHESDTADFAADSQTHSSDLDTAGRLDDVDNTSEETSSEKFRRSRRLLEDSVRHLLDRAASDDQMPRVEAYMIAEATEWNVYRFEYKPNKNLENFQRKLKAWLTKLDAMDKTWFTADKKGVSGQEQFRKLARDCLKQRDTIRKNARNSIKVALQEVLRMDPPTTLFVQDDLNNMATCWEELIFEESGDDVADYHEILQNDIDNFEDWQDSWTDEWDSGFNGQELFETKFLELFEDYSSSPNEPKTTDYGAEQIDEAAINAPSDTQGNDSYDNVQSYETQNDASYDQISGQSIVYQESPASPPSWEQGFNGAPDLDHGNYSINPDSGAQYDSSGLAAQANTRDPHVDYNSALLPYKHDHGTGPSETANTTQNYNIGPALLLPFAIPGLNAAAQIAENLPQSEQHDGAAFTTFQDHQAVDGDDEMDLGNDEDFYGIVNQPDAPTNAGIVEQQPTSQTYEDYDMDLDVPQPHVTPDQTYDFAQTATTGASATSVPEGTSSYEPLSRTSKFNEPRAEVASSLPRHPTKADMPAEDASTDFAIPASDDETDDLAAAILFELENAESSTLEDLEPSEMHIDTPTSLPTQAPSGPNPDDASSETKSSEPTLAKESAPRLFAGISLEAYETTFKANNLIPPQKLKFDFGVSTADLSQLKREAVVPQSILPSPAATSQAVEEPRTPFLWLLQSLRRTEQKIRDDAFYDSMLRKLLTSDDSVKSPIMLSQDPSSAAPSHLSISNIAVTIDVAPTFEAHRLIVASPEQVEKVMHNHDVKHRELLERMQHLQDMIANLQCSGSHFEPEQIETIVIEIKDEVKVFGTFPEQHITDQLASTSGMAIVPEEKDQDELTASEEPTQEIIQDSERAREDNATAEEDFDQALIEVELEDVASINDTEQIVLDHDVSDKQTDMSDLAESEVTLNKGKLTPISEHYSSERRDSANVELETAIVDHLVENFASMSVNSDEDAIDAKATPEKSGSAQSDERVEKDPEILELTTRIEKCYNEWLSTPISDLPRSLHNLGQNISNAYTNIDTYSPPSVRQLGRQLKNWKLLMNMVDKYLCLRNHLDNTTFNKLQDLARAIRSDQMSINNWTTLAARARAENKELGAQRYDRFAAPAIAHKEYFVDKANEDLSAISAAYRAYYNAAQIAWTDYELFIKESSLEAVLNVTLKDFSAHIRDAYEIFGAVCEDMSIDSKEGLDDEL
ncbi:hypothetical protein FB567DRAFT_599057 [Paraphoma chrysanthemicola]|uniref:Uncharacterized protein n=1 Tax=Paraphoma chrysanthemicola TaxID=798071 RepID=A0A8K0QSE2_9PLEO|nr:hypothetical protein FB567DRAFT_599057 [Paraphoma chrysanthemicola]